MEVCLWRKNGHEYTQIRGMLVDDGRDAHRLEIRRLADGLGRAQITILPTNFVGVLKPPTDIVRYLQRTGVQFTVGTDIIDGSGVARGWAWGSGGCNPKR
jgi:hypothetical protein